MCFFACNLWGLYYIFISFFLEFPFDLVDVWLGNFFFDYYFERFPFLDKTLSSDALGPGARASIPGLSLPLFIFFWIFPSPSWPTDPLELGNSGFSLCLVPPSAFVP